MGALLLCLLAGIFDGPGTTAVPLLRVGQGPRAAALGDAGTAGPDDASAVVWNPAALGCLTEPSLALSHHAWFLETSDEVAHAALPAGTGALGLGLAYSASRGIQRWSETNLPGDTFAVWCGTLSAGYGAPVARRVWLGAAGKLLCNDLRDVTGIGAGLDVGLLCRPAPRLNVGLAGRNLGALAYRGDVELLPAELALGASTCLGPFAARADAVWPGPGMPDLRGGIEYAPVSSLALRLGYRTGPADITTLGWHCGLTAGLGVRVGRFAVDYAFAPYGRLGTTHRIGLGLRVPRRGTSSVRFRVLDAGTGRPLRARLALSGIRRSAVRTDDYGESRVSRLPAGRLLVRASLEDYLPLTDSVTVREAETNRIVTLLLQPVSFGAVWGALRDAGTGQPLAGMVAWQGPGSDSVPVDAAGGSFALHALAAGRYVFTAAAADGTHQPQTCTLAVEPGRLIQRDFALVSAPRPVVFPGLLFAPTSVEIDQTSDAVLQSVARTLVEQPALVVEVAGHADGYEVAGPRLGSLAALSQARADAVRRRLIDRYGIKPGQLVARGYAELRPLAPSDTPAGQAANRCVELTVTRQ
jgi:outer membrane protein OmpA-like peptidoglycan-associated protein